MPCYQQMGHQSDNLLYDRDLSGYHGAVLSPVNYAVEELIAKTAKARFLGGYDVIFDPQLYVPRAQRGRLAEWAYYPSDLETADLASTEWWAAVTDALVGACEELRPDAICSPAPKPREFSAEYFTSLIATGTHLAKKLDGHVRTRAIQTAIVGLNYLAAAPDRPLQTASILSKSKCEEIYLVLDVDREPRRELNDDEQLAGAMKLISAIEGAGLRVIVAFSSSDMILWKAAGATHCATGKFFNVRRFTSTRFEAGEAAGGSQQPYWFEQSLLAFLRLPDVLMLQPTGLLGGTIQENPIAKQIIAAPEEPWLALSWKQYLYWFAQAERKLANRQVRAEQLLETARKNWRRLKTEDAIMTEPQNDGAWLASWQKALVDYRA